MIEFRVLKYKHFLQAQELSSRIDKGEASEGQLLEFAASLVKTWDFIDADTNEAIPVGEIDELSQPQFTELLDQFSAKFTGEAVVPKVNAAP